MEMSMLFFSLLRSQRDGRSEDVYHLPGINFRLMSLLGDCCFNDVISILFRWIDIVYYLYLFYRRTTRKENFPFPQYDFHCTQCLWTFTFSVFCIRYTRILYRTMTTHMACFSIVISLSRSAIQNNEIFGGESRHGTNCLGKFYFGLYELLVTMSWVGFNVKWLVRNQWEHQLNQLYFGIIIHSMIWSILYDTMEDRPVKDTNKTIWKLE